MSYNKKMKNPSLFLLVFLIVTITFVISSKAVAEEAEYVPGEVLVKFKDSVDVRTMQDIHTFMKAKKRREFKKHRIHHLKLSKEMSVEEAVRRYREDPNVEYAEPNYIVHMAVIPGDTSFGQLWGLHNTGQSGGTPDADIDAPEAWDIETGNSNDIVIAVVDTGVAYNHPDLVNNIWTNPDESVGDANSDGFPGIAGVDDDGDGLIDEDSDGREPWDAGYTNDLVNDDDENGYPDDIYGWDFVDEDGEPLDLNGHGTHVAGTIAAQGNNGQGITGVMWNARIMSVRFLGLTGSGSTADAILAIDYASDNGAQVMNNSWGGGGYSQALKEVIDASSAVMVFAAGNSDPGKNNDSSPFYPASYDSPHIISVAATDDDDNLAGFSNYGATTVDLGAPGVSIYSTIPQYTYGAPTIVYDSLGFESSSGPLPQQVWDRGGTNSTWEITTGGKCISNCLEDSPGGNYSGDTWAYYTTPVNSFIKGNRYMLSFNWRGVLEPGDWLDIIYSHNGTSWNWIDYRTGTQPDFTPYSADYTAVAQTFDSFYFGFRIDSNSSDISDGVYIDDVKMTREDIIIDPDGYTYTNFRGTSMATPHVSGVAGLILADNPNLTNLQVKDLILNNVDPVPDLSCKVLTGGRLNAHKALLNPDPPNLPSGLSATAVSSSQINLSWNDNSTNENGFMIERKRSIGGTCSLIAIVGQNVKAYSSTGLSDSTTYYYRVRAYSNTSGGSAYSNEANATTNAIAGGGGGGGGDGGGGGFCFIATAAYGSYLAPEVEVLKEFRDKYLLTNSAGKSFVKLYYRYSPPLADFIRGSGFLRAVSRALLTPVIMLIIYPYASYLIILALFLFAFYVFRLYKKNRAYADPYF